MNKLIPIILALLFVLFLVSCGDNGADSKDTAGGSEDAGTTIADKVPETTKAQTTEAPDVTKEAEKEPETEKNPPEDLIDYESVKSSKTEITHLIDLDSLDWDVDGFDEAESAPMLFDGDTATKYCCSLPPSITFNLTEPKKVTAYAFATANDNSQYGRSPEEFILFGSTDGKDWKILDYVQEGSQIIERVDFTYYAFLIDADKQGDYKYYQFEVYEVEGGTTFQMSEFQLFTD